MTFSAIDIDTHPLLPAAPFSRWLRKQLATSGLDFVPFCRSIGIDPRNVVRFIRDEQPHVHVCLADKALTRRGFHLVDLWPELYPECDFDLFGGMYERAA